MGCVYQFPPTSTAMKSFRSDGDRYALATEAGEVYVGTTNTQCVMLCQSRIDGNRINYTVADLAKPPTKGGFPTLKALTVGEQCALVERIGMIGVECVQWSPHETGS